MRGWFHLLLQIGAVIALVSGAVQAQSVSAWGETPVRHVMATGDAGDQGGVTLHHDLQMDSGLMTDHPMGNAVCKHLCTFTAIEPVSAPVLIVTRTKTASLRLFDSILFPSLRPDLAERPPKSRL